MASAEKKDGTFNPFPGLRPFTPDESEYFFGRKFESEEIAGKLKRNRFVAVTGASGSGKSSLVVCGLLSWVRDISLKEGLDWQIIEMRPGNDPFGNLVRSALQNSNEGNQQRIDQNDILSILREKEDGIDLLIEKLYEGRNTKVLLFIDQFEDLFRYGSPEKGIGLVDEAGAFIELLTKTVIKGNPDFHLVIALRSDFLPECEKYKGFTDIINNSSFHVSQMKRENIREAIVRPVLNAGAQIDNDLVELLLDEVDERSDRLPVLQHALMRTWTYWKELNEPERPIDFSDYSSIGTLKDAISRHADEIYFRVNQKSRIICEKLFKLITGKGSDNKNIRYPSNVRTIRLAALCTNDELYDVIEEFRNPSISFLIPHISVPLDDDTIIDLSHESLINLWDRLKKWIDEESFSAQTYQRLSEASALYQQGKTGLLAQPELQLAIKWRDENKPTLWWAQKYDPAFERAMVYLRTSEKEFLESEERKAKRHRWKLHRIKIISSILGGIAIFTSIVMLGTFVLKISADNRRKNAEKQVQEIESQKEAAVKCAAIAFEKSLELDSTASAALQRERMEREMRESAEGRIFRQQAALNIALEQYDSAARASRLAVLNADSAIEIKNETQRLRMISVARSMSLRSLQMTEQDDLQALLAYQAFLFNKENNGSRNDGDIYMGLYTLAKMKGSSRIKTFSGLESPVRSIAFVPGKKEFYASDSYGRILKGDLNREGQDLRIIYSGDEIIDVLAVSPEADWLAAGGVKSTIKMIPVDGDGLEYELKGHTGSIKSLIFSYDGKSLYSAAIDGRVLKWDLAARSSTDISTGGVRITSIDLSLNDRYMAGVSENGDATVWEPGKDSNKFRIESPGRIIRKVKFKPDEDRIAVGYDDGMVELWDITRREKIMEFKAHKSEIKDMQFNNKSGQLATSGNDGTLKLWDSSDFISPPVIFNDNEGMVVTIDFSSDGEVFIAGSMGKQSRIISRPAYADSFAADGCTYVTRNFTPDEWQAYVGKDIEYEKTCPGADLKIKIREIR